MMMMILKILSMSTIGCCIQEEIYKFDIYHSSNVTEPRQSSNLSWSGLGKV